MSGQSLLKGIVHLLLPDACVACDALLPAQLAGPFCAICAAEVLEIPEAHCRRCSEPGRFIGACRACLRRPPSFRRAWAPWEFDGAVTRAIRRFKFQDRPDLARPLGEALARAMLLYKVDFRGEIVPIPPLPVHFRQRRYDHAALLAAAFARVTGGAVNLEVLARARACLPQVGLSEAERRENLKDAFVATRPVQGRAFLLLDDVFTTGTTLREAARALRCRGASVIHALTIARASRTEFFRP